MSCSINDSSLKKWTIKPEHINKLLSYTHEKSEFAGEIIMNNSTNQSSKVITSTSGYIDSVEAPDSIINWHCHPVTCYTREKVVYGWPSGEDMRETLISGIKGCACHIVPSIEGIYTIQTNLCTISKMLDLSDSGDFLRGLFVSTIEIYFRSTHVFRSFGYTEKYSDMKPENFVKFANDFKFSNAYSLFTFENGKKRKISFKQYVNSYEKNTYVFNIDKNGQSTNSGILYSDIINSQPTLLKKLMTGSVCNIPNGNWKQDEIYKINFYKNSVYNGSKWMVYNEMSMQQKTSFLSRMKSSRVVKYADAPITFYLFDLKGSCDNKHIMNYIQSKNKRLSKKKMKIYGRMRISKKKSSKRSKSTSLNRSMGKSTKISKHNVVLMGSNACGYCKESDHVIRTSPNFNRIKYTFKEYPGIADAIKEINKTKINGELLNTSTIPVFLVDNKRVTKESVYDLVA